MAKKKNQYDYHHRLPRAQGGTDTFPENNLVKVRRNKHAAFHLMFDGMRVPEDVLFELVKVWLPPGISIDVRYNGEAWTISEHLKFKHK